MIYDTVIIGSGPAGLAAAIYAKRAGLQAIILEKNPVSGGQVLNTDTVDNYPGLMGINGFEMGMKFREHAENLGAEFSTDAVEKILEDNKTRRVIGENKEYQTKTVLIATGAGHKKLGVPGEQELIGKGVSYCATCDGAFFRGKTVTVIGGGDVAVEDAIYLSRLCKKVYVVHRRNEFRAARMLSEQLEKAENVEIIWDTVVERIDGEDKVKSIEVQNVNTKEKSAIETDGVFIAIGIVPDSKTFQGIVKMDSAGYIEAGEDGVTSAQGIFVAGDVRTKDFRQILTAAADGANAIYSIEKFLIENPEN